MIAHKYTAGAVITGVLVATLAASVLWVAEERGQAEGSRPPSEAMSVTNTSLVFGKPSDAKITISGYDGSLQWTVKTPSGQVVASGSEASAPSATLRPRVPSSGLYSLEATDRDGEATTKFLVTGPAPSVQDPFFSVATHWGKESFASTTWPLARTLPLVTAVGFSRIRDETAWQSVEADRDSYAVPDFAVALSTATQKSNLHTMLVAGYGDPRAYPQDMKDTMSPPTSAEGRTGYVNYINTVLDANPNIDKVEVWNEFNRPKRNTSSCQSGTCYAALVQAVFQGVKAAHPDVQIVAGDTAGTPISWFQEFIDAGGLRYCDLISTHGYSSDTGALRQSITHLDDLVKKHNGGVSKPIIVSEVGLSNTAVAPPHQYVSRVGTQEQAAAGLVKIFVTLKSIPAVTQVVWYDAIDDGTDLTDPQANFGLFRQPTHSISAFEPKITAAAASYLIRQLAGYRLSSSSTPAPGVSEFVFTAGDGSTRRVLWDNAAFAADDSPTTTVPVTARSGYRTTVTTLTGEKIRGLPPGRINLDVGTQPIFIDESQTSR
ncbi:hypothetical protein MMX123_00961 [Microbacterium sp. MM2322]|uniref:glycosyl hydrolase n=1 Tax=Microbacterium sp. MM2322 TaxID=3157631 RepID=UPI003D808713